MPQERIPLSSPSISQKDIDAVVSVLQTRHLSLGPALPKFEQDIASYVHAQHAVAVNSGTSALHLCIRALDIHDGDEVITTPFSFVASANCLLFERAKPVFVDIEPKTYCIDVSQVEAAITPKTKAILAVDVFGYLCDWDALRAIAKKHNLVLIEDSCEALGSTRNGVHAGMFGDCGMFAFYPNKQMTTGEGGIIVTNEDRIASLTRSMRNQGRGEGDAWLLHERLGYNYRLSDINCALGSSQLTQLEGFITKRAQVVAWYREELAPLAEHITAPEEQPGVRVSWFVCVARLADHFSEAQRDKLIMFLKNEGIGCSNYFPSIHLQPLYVQEFGFKKGDFPVTEAVSAHTIALPFHSALSRDDVRTVCATLAKGFSSISR